MFMNELELLELRLMTLYNVVDYFVLIEAGVTHSGKPKLLHYNENKDMFSKYSDKIIHIKVDTLPFKDAWKNENYNRNLLMEGISNAMPDDYIMVSDVDEIPNPLTLMQGINNNYNVFTLRQKLFYYYINCLQNQLWAGTVISKRNKMNTMQGLRDIRNSGINLLSDGGWHYSFLGGDERIRIKLESYAEIQTNNNTVNNKEHILKCLKTGDDLFNRNDEMSKKRFISLNEINHPELNEWLIKYPNMIKI